MIRKLSETDREITLKFLVNEPSINLFIIGDIECFGFNEDFQELWGSFNEINELNGVLLRFHQSYIPYFRDLEFDITEFKNIITKDKNIKIISGREDIVLKFSDILVNPRLKSMHFCELTNKDRLNKIDERVVLAKEDDAERIYDLLLDIDEFDTEETNSPEKILKTISSKSGRIYCIKNENGDLCTVSQTTAESSSAAMIVGVATKKEFRQKGLMTICLTKLCKDLIDEGKSLCLFYNNPDAGKVYHKLGFVTIDKWMMAVEKSRSKI